MTVNVAALVDQATIPVLDDLLSLYNGYVDRSRAEKRRMRRALAVVKDEKLLDMRALFTLPEAWNVDSTPAIAIAPMHWTKIGFTNWMGGRAGFHALDPSYHSLDEHHVVRIPPGPGTPNMHHHALEAAVPPTPKSVAPRWSWQRRDCFVLFDTPVWRRTVPADPFLLKRVSDTQFRVLGHWDLTDRERALMQMIGF